MMKMMIQNIISKDDYKDFTPTGGLYGKTLSNGVCIIKFCCVQELLIDGATFGVGIANIAPCIENSCTDNTYTIR